MARAVLYLHASAEDNAALEEGEIHTTSWSGLVTDTAYIYKNTFSRMERDLERALLKRACTKTDCSYRSERKLRMQQHIESPYTCAHVSTSHPITTRLLSMGGLVTTMIDPWLHK